MRPVIGDRPIGKDPAKGQTPVDCRPGRAPGTRFLPENARSVAVLTHTVRQMAEPDTNVAGPHRQ